MVLKRAGYFTGLIGKSNIFGLRQTELDYYCGADSNGLGFYPKEKEWPGPWFAEPGRTLRSK
jgi:hypothetical protein